MYILPREQMIVYLIKHEKSFIYLNVFIFYNISTFVPFKIPGYRKIWKALGRERERENLALFNFLTLSTLKKFSSAAFGQSFSTEVLD